MVIQASSDLDKSSSAVHPAVIIRQRKTFRRTDGVSLYFEGLYGRYVGITR